MSKSQEDHFDDYYHDDVTYESGPKKPLKKLSLKLSVLAISSAVAYSLLGTTFAANIQMGSGRLEYGQGYTQATACDSDITATPYATFANASGNNASYKLTDIQISNIGTGCYGKDLIIRAYDSSTATSLDLYQPGSSTIYNSVRVFDDNGLFNLADSGLTANEINTISNGFKVTLFNNASPAVSAKASSSSVYKITVETVEHDSSLSQTIEPSGSLTFNGTSTALYYNSNTAFDLGSSDFTIDVWANVTDNSNQTFYDAGGDVNSAGSFAFWIENRLLKIRRNGGADISYTLPSSVLGTFHHYAAVRGNSYFRMYIDGTKVVEALDSVWSITQKAPTVGRLYNYSGYFLKGQLRNIRLVKGTALYSSNFTPPTAPLSKIAGTSLLLLAQNQTNPTYDSSDNHFVPNNSSTLPTWVAP